MLKENCQKKQPLPSVPLTADRLFSASPAGTLERLSAIKQKKYFPQEAFVYQNGEVPHGVYILLEGEARVVCRTESGEKKIIRPIERNEIIGLTETLADVSCHANIETVTPCVFEYIESKDFLDFLREERDTCFRLVQILADNLQKSFRIFAEL